MTDYRKLCLELFGTDDENELRRIAGKGKPGRKAKLTPEDVDKAAKMIAAGSTVAEAAEVFGVSRQTLSSRLNRPGAKGQTVRLNYMFRQKVCSVILLDFANRKVSVTNRTDDILHRAFGVNETPSWEDLELFLSERCFPESRGDKKELLKKMGLPGYDPLQIIELTGGRMAEDGQYFNITYYGEKK